MKDFLLFKKMVSPVLIQVIFWLGIVSAIVSGIASMMHVGIFYGIWLVVIGILMTRVVCEILMLFFRMNDNLREIRNSLKK